MLNQRMKVSLNINKKGSYFGLGHTVVVGSQCSYQPGMFIVWKPDRTSARYLLVRLPTSGEETFLVIVKNISLNNLWLP